MSQKGGEVAFKGMKIETPTPDQTNDLQNKQPETPEQIKERKKAERAARKAAAAKAQAAAGKEDAAKRRIYLYLATVDLIEEVIKDEKKIGLERSDSTVTDDLVRAGKAVSDHRIEIYNVYGETVAVERVLSKDVKFLLELFESYRREFFERHGFRLSYAHIADQILSLKQWKEALDNPSFIFGKKSDDKEGSVQ
jgi:hypothetical protein